MRSIWELSRRTFLKVTGLAVVARTAASVPSVAAALPPIPARGFEVLTDAQVATLEAIVEQLIPKDEYPGARDALVVRYIDRVLAREQRDRRPAYVAGLAATDRTSTAMFGRSFAALDEDRQTRVLQTIDTGKVDPSHWPDVDRQQFFHLVWTHTLEGFYGSPEYGGNVDHASWKMVGYPIAH
jgi:gluconate 2-dehydrogenase gamma chain